MGKKKKTGAYETSTQEDNFKSSEVIKRRQEHGFDAPEIKLSEPFTITLPIAGKVPTNPDREPKKIKVISISTTPNGGIIALDNHGRIFKQDQSEDGVFIWKQLNVPGLPELDGPKNS